MLCPCLALVITLVMYISGWLSMHEEVEIGVSYCVYYRQPLHKDTGSIGHYKWPNQDNPISILHGQLYLKYTVYIGPFDICKDILHS